MVGLSFLNRPAAATPSAPLRSEIIAAGGWLMAAVGPVRLRHEVPTDVDLAVASFLPTPGHQLPGKVARNVLSGGER